MPLLHEGLTVHVGIAPPRVPTYIEFSTGIDMRDYLVESHIHMYIYARTRSKVSKCMIASAILIVGYVVLLDHHIISSTKNNNTYHSKVVLHVPPRAISRHRQDSTPRLLMRQDFPPRISAKILDM